MWHAKCQGCMILTPAQRDAPDGVARHNIRTGMADVPRIVGLAQKHTDNGEWQASLSWRRWLLRWWHRLRKRRNRRHPAHPRV